ncbi:O-antigen ligase family protein [Nocardioides dokdonensis]|uniref:O-antigen ligase family protein n=1 Tax=Nocardioides dokdonensis TaxID=450734 RepID=UPI0012F76384|nr:O-antigen ligase domain-containing protein [Nocardioides dokdonensis]
MSVAVRPGLVRPDAGQRGRNRRVVVGLVWGALFLNVLTFADTQTVVPIPGSLAKLLTQGALPLALLLVVVANRRGVVRPQLFLVLLTLLAVGATAASLYAEFFASATFRAGRMVLFILVLWLLSPFFGRRDLLLLRCHRICLSVILGTVYLGALLSPGLAFAFQGRLSGVIWPIPPTQVAHYAAVLLGTSLLLWMCRVVVGRHAALMVVFSFLPLVAAHTRTALLAVVIGMAVASASLFLGHVRVRRTVAVSVATGALVAVVFASPLTVWLLRGQSAEEANRLTGRTNVWSAVAEIDRPWIEDLFGWGLSNQSFDGLPIDSSWVATYVDQGWFGVGMQGAVLLLLLLTALVHVRGPQRAIALFLVAYCTVASITETGLGAPSAYVLDLAVAAALLMPERREEAS